MNKNVPYKNDSLIWIVLGIMLNGCSTTPISSQLIDANKDTGDGIVYYMPKRPIRLEITVAARTRTFDQNETTVYENTIGKEENDKGKTTNKTQITFTKKIPYSDQNEKEVTVKVIDNVVTETLPDLKQGFLLQYNKNWLAKNRIAIEVNRLGILSITHADTDNQLGEIAKNIASDIAATSLGYYVSSNENSGVSPPPESPSEIKTLLANSDTFGENSVTITTSTKCNDGVYKLLINPPGPDIKQNISSGNVNGDKNKIIYQKNLCGVTLSIERSFESHPKQSRRISDISPSCLLDDDGKPWRCIEQIAQGFDLLHYHNPINSSSGVFYRQDLPYIINVKNDNNNEESNLIAFSPSESNVFYAPIKGTIFADNTTDISLNNGIITKFNSQIDSEFLALTSVPADIMGAYFGSIGKGLTDFGSVLKSQNENATLQLVALQTLAKYMQCQAAIASNTVAGKSGDDLDEAISKIKSACSN